jgi:hypothetical protein
MDEPATESDARLNRRLPRNERPPKPFEPRTTPQWAAAYARALIEAARYRDRFGEVERFCFFIGYPRSGHSLLASLIDANPEVVIANELDALRYVAHGFRRSQVYGLLLWHEQRFTARGRKKGDFDYAVPGGHQGAATRLRVIGDKRGGWTAIRLAADISVLDQVRDLVGVPIRVIQHSRNPFDTIATAARFNAADSDPPVTKAIQRYCRWSSNLALVRRHLQPDELLDTRHEQLISDPKEELARAYRFIGVDAEPTLLDRCASTVWPSPRRSRDSVRWTDEHIESVEEMICTYPWLSGYTFGEE